MTQSSELSPQSYQPASWLITGGCGFIGVNLIDYLIKQGYTNLRILDNLSVGKREDLKK